VEHDMQKTLSRANSPEFKQKGYKTFPQNHHAQNSIPNTCKERNLRASISLSIIARRQKYTWRFKRDSEKLLLFSSLWW